MLRWVTQAVGLAAFMAILGYASTDPPYHHRGPGDAQILVSFSHAGARAQDCRPLTPEEIAALAANMRRTTECQRARVPLLFQLDIDGTTHIDALLPPSGIASDGTSTAYARMAIPSGPHRIAVRLRDSRRDAGFDWERVANVELAPRQNFTIDFTPETGGFIFR